MLSQADATGDVDAVTWAKRMLKDDGADEPFVGLVHRLDRPASGVLLMARTSEAARALSKAFRERSVEKRYLAVVNGTLRGVGRWTDTIAKIGRDPQVVAPDHPDGKHAEATWQALRAEEGRTLVQVQLETGRPHQIRLHCATRGHPVIGDVRHGAEEALDGRTVALHHALLRVEHPDTHRVHSFTTPVPEVWDPLLTDAMRDVIRNVLR